MPPENEDVLQKLAPSIVEIISDTNSITLGTGFIVTEEGLIVTCRHVIADSKDKLMNSVKVRFHSDNKTHVKKFTATPVKEDQDFKDDPSIDIAFLRLDKLPEKGVTPVRLDDRVVSLNEFVTIGFRKAHEFSGLMAQGSIGILTHVRISDDILSPEVIQLYHKKQIEPGMSGAPVFDVKRNRVVGIITERFKPIDFTDEDTLAFALPVKSMLDRYPSLREKNEGLTLLSKFLSAIGEESFQIYKWIDEVYVPPNEYEEIKKSLKSNRIVFITGTKEFGKTFTAVRLMYEFFKEGGYQPRWVKERKESGREGADPQELLKLIGDENYIKPHEIVYFEDPFGKTRYERSNDLENYIGRIINSIKKVQDAHIIITSREEIFKEFEREQLSSIELANFEKKMNLKKTSYDSEKRKEMLLRWAKVSNCKWLLDSDLKKLVLAAVENQKLLPTPLNIKDFVKASYDVLDSQELNDLIKQISKETTGRFADEIIRMEEDEKVMFLAFAYVGNGSLDIDIVKKIYESIIVAWTESNKKYYVSFERLRKWFEGDKINISEDKIAFSHSSYHEAFQYAVGSEKRYNDRINGDRIRHIFEEVLLRLVDEEHAAFEVADAVSANFNKLQHNVQQLLFKLADNVKIAWWVTYSMRNNFDKLPPNIREQLLLKVAAYDNEDSAWDVSHRISDNFDKLPPNIREQLLLKLADNHRPAIMILDIIDNNFDKLPPNIREQLLLKLAQYHKTANVILAIIRDHFDKLPPNIREQLLLKLADNANNIIQILSDSSSSDSIRKEILVGAEEEKIREIKRLLRQ